MTAVTESQSWSSIDQSRPAVGLWRGSFRCGFEPGTNAGLSRRQELGDAVLDEQAFGPTAIDELSRCDPQLAGKILQLDSFLGHDSIVLVSQQPCRPPRAAFPIAHSTCLQYLQPGNREALPEKETKTVRCNNHRILTELDSILRLSACAPGRVAE